MAGFGKNTIHLNAALADELRSIGSGAVGHLPGDIRIQAHTGIFLDDGKLQDFWRCHVPGNYSLSKSKRASISLATAFSSLSLAVDSSLINKVWAVS